MNETLYSYIRSIEKKNRKKKKRIGILKDVYGEDPYEYLDEVQEFYYPYLKFQNDE